jgi:hypothetical protein
MAPKRTVAVVELTVLPGGRLVEPEPFECHSDCTVLFVISNTEPQGGTTYYVGLNTSDTIYMSDFDPGGAAPPSRDPFASPGKSAKQVRPGETDTLKLRILSKGNFGKSKPLQYTTYKYTLICATNATLSNATDTLDPGFVITPP